MTAQLFRDDWGIPHLRAEDELELAEAQGRVTALDRAWQIDADRWRAEGRLAERIGPGGLEWDRFARRSRIADTARNAYLALSPGDRAWVDAYVAGVNSTLPRGRRVPEFEVVAGLPGDDPAPEPWPPWAPLGILLVKHILFSNLPGLLWRGHAAATVGPLAWVFGSEPPPDSGSNAWALHGSRTASGFPLLAGDPHRVFDLPGVYQQIRLACPEYDVVGLAFPGLPGLPHFGHAGDAAWGITNAVAHITDVYRERLRRTGTGVEALGPAGWRPAFAAIERIAVRGAEPVEVEVIETERGPVIGGGPDAEHALSIRLPSRVSSDLGIAALRPLLRATTADDVARAFTRWVDPVNRVVAADRGGRVIRFTAGRVPIREQADRRLPLDAGMADPLPGWREMPAPEVVHDIAVDANEQPERAAHDLGFGYYPDYRAHRIRVLLEQARPDTADMAVVWNDVVAGAADDLLTATAGLDGLSEPALALRSRLFAWDRSMAADSVDAGDYAAFRAALVRRIVQRPELTALGRPHGLGAIFDPPFLVHSRVFAALPLLLGGGLADIAADLRAALEEVVAGESTTWGDRHRLRPRHLLSEVPGVPSTAVPGVPAVRLGGDSDCVRSTGSLPGVSDGVVRGSVARWAWDLGDRERSRWIVPFGTSGDPRSPHFGDQLALWSTGRTTEVVTDWSALHPATLHDDPPEHAEPM